MPSRRCWTAVALGLLLLAGAFPVEAGVPPVGWGSAALLEIYNFGNAGDPQVSFNAAGAGFAVWWEFDGTRNSIFSNQFLPASGWGVASLVEADNAGNAAAPQVAVDAGGNAVAVWNQSDGMHDNIWSSRFVAGSGWENATLLETDDAGNASAPQVAADPNGTAFAVWYQSDGSRDNIYANQYDTSAGWSGARLLENGSAGDARKPQVAAGTDGTAFAVWYQSDGSRDNIYANRYDRAAGWGSAALLENASGNARNPQIALGPYGTAFAIWFQRSGSRDNIMAERYAPASGWGSAELLEADNAGNARDPQIAVDASGAAFAVWYQGDGRRDNLWAQRFAPGAGWGTPELIETNNAGDANGPEIAVDGQGGAVAAWSQTDGLRINIWTNHYTSPDITPPDLSLTSPLEGATSASPSVWIAGTTEPGAMLAVNGVVASVSPNGSFGLMITVAPGANRIAVTATDAWGNEASSSVNITVGDPAGDLQRQVDDALAALNASQANLAAAEARLASAEANLSLATTDAQALQAALTAARSDLAAAQANLTAALDGLAAVEASIPRIQSQIDLAQGDLNASAAHLAALEADQNASQADIDVARLQLQADHARVAALEGDLAAAQSRLAEQLANVTELKAAADAQAQRLAATEVSLADEHRQAEDSAARAAQAGSLALAAVLVALLAGALGVLAWVAARRRAQPAPPAAPSVTPRTAHLTSSGAQTERRAGETESDDDVTRRHGHG